MLEFVSGALCYGFGVVALFFLRFWRKTGDRLFAFLALSFATMALSRFLLSFLKASENGLPYAYFFRLLANLLIIYGIIDKNRDDEHERASFASYASRPSRP